MSREGRKQVGISYRNPVSITGYNNINYSNPAEVKSSLTAERGWAPETEAET